MSAPVRPLSTHTADSGLATSIWAQPLSIQPWVAVDALHRLRIGGLDRSMQPFPMRVSGPGSTASRADDPDLRQRHRKQTRPSRSIPHGTRVPGTQRSKPQQRV